MHTCSSCHKSLPIDAYTWNKSKLDFNKTCVNCNVKYKSWYDREGRLKKQQRCSSKRSVKKANINLWHSQKVMQEKRAAMDAKADELLERCRQTNREVQLIITRYNKRLP